MCWGCRAFHETSRREAVTVPGDEGIEAVFGMPNMMVS
jgi:hypothetical protein